MGVAAASELIAPGSQLGKYRVIHRIAFGGMAEIYLARASGIQGFEKYVVLKRILPQFAANHELIRMFLQEAKLAAILDHANIAQVHDIGEQDGVFFFTMEYLHGEDARRMMKEMKARGERIPLEHAVHVVIDAAAGVHFAHEKKGPDGTPLGIVHRDLSPSNIVVTFAGGVKVVDFGVAKIAADAELSGRYSLKGKLAYMSPEQVAQGSVDRRSDVFALGIVLYELTTGKRLFKGGNEVETMRLVLDANVAKPSEVIPAYPPDLERIVLRALERSPERRYQSARDLQFDLEAFARDQKLQISSAALAEWMEAAFGPKREIWHLLPTDANTQTPANPSELTAATRKVTHEALHELGPNLRPRARSRRVMLIAAAALLLIPLIAGGTVALRRSADSAAPSHIGAGGGGAVFVVSENGNVAVESGAARPTGAAAAPAPATAPVPEPAPVPAASPVSPASHGKRSHRAAGNEDLSSAVAKQSGDIRRCFAALEVDEASLGEISMRFEIGVGGAVKSVAVLPAAVGASPLGTCLAKVGRNTRFAPQAKSIAFRIPLTVQLRHQARDGR